MNFDNEISRVYIILKVDPLPEMGWGRGKHLHLRLISVRAVFIQPEMYWHTAMFSRHFTKGIA